MRAVMLAVLAVTAVGCASSAHRNLKVLRKQAAFDFNCPQGQIQVTPYGGRDEREFIAQGCGRRAMYKDLGEGPVLSGAIEGGSVGGPAPVGGPVMAPPPPPPPPPAPPSK